MSIKPLYPQKKRAVLISGKQGSGKTTLARALEQAMEYGSITPKVMKMADPLYQMHDIIYQVLGQYGVKTIDLLPNNERIDGMLLQVLGTDWGRKRDTDLWVKIARARIQRLGLNELAIFDDIRFHNELDVIHKEYSVKVRLDCHWKIRKRRAQKWREMTNHPSEISLDEQEELFDLVYDTGTCDMQSMVDDILKLIL